MSGRGKPRITIGLTAERLELLDEVSAMMGLLYGQRPPGRPQTIEHMCRILRGQLKTSLAKQERRAQK